LAELKRLKSLDLPPHHPIRLFSKGIKRGEAPLGNSLPSPLTKGRGIKGEGLVNNLPIGVHDLHPDSLSRILLSTYERQPNDFEQLLGLKGVGPKTIRALSLISELVYGVAPSYRDPARYSFAHGGKDGIPYPVDRKTYDQSIELLGQAINKTKLGIREKRETLNRLNRIRVR